MLSFFLYFLNLHTVIHAHSYKHILQQNVRGLGGERCMIRMPMNAQNGTTGAAGIQLSGIRERLAELQGYSCMHYVGLQP